MELDTKEFGLAIAKRRNVMRISQEALAERASIHRTYVSQIERGIKVPTLTVLFSLAAALECYPSELLREIETG